MRIGFIGLGAMGAGIAARLLDAGYEVTGWNRTRARAEPLIERGLGWGDTPRAVAAGTDVVFTMLTDTAAVDAIADGPDGILAGLREGGVWADMSTISRDASAALATRVAAGRRAARRAGVGQHGDARRGPDVGHGRRRRGGLRARPARSARDRAEGDLRRRQRPGAADEGRDQPRPRRAGRRVAEGIALAEKGGVRREAAVDAMLKSVVASPVIGYRAPLILDENADHPPYADVDLQQKDVLLALDLGRGLSAALPLTATANELLNAMRGLGLAKRDFVLVHQVYRRLAGMAE